MTTQVAGSMAFVPAARRDLPGCLEILMDSILGEQYFSREIAEAILSEAISKQEITIARRSSGEIVGFYRLVLDGAFLVFAYIHLIVVKAAYRGEGIGTRLLYDAEQKILDEQEYPDIKKAFLLVGKANRRATRYYRQNGYSRVGTLHDLFADGDTEYLMVKELRT